MRTVPTAIVHTIEPRASSFSIVKPGTKVITIEPSADALSVEEVVKLFGAAFEQVCALKVIDKLGANSLTQELTAAEITAVFRGQGSGRAAQSEPQPGVHL